MSDSTPSGASPSVATLVGGLLEDTQQLIRQETALARHEIREEWTKTKEAATLFSGALALFALVGVLFGFSLVELLHHFVFPHDLWACFSIVAILFAVCGGALLYESRAKLHQVHLVPPQSAASLRQDIQAVTSAVTAAQDGIVVRQS
jgi:hypothetical protein